MSRWSVGEAEIEQLLAEGRLQAVTGAQADGAAWVTRAPPTSQPTPPTQTRRGQRGDRQRPGIIDAAGSFFRI